jgi:hypothetical protein
VKSTKDLTGQNAELDNSRSSPEQKLESRQEVQHIRGVSSQSKPDESTEIERNEKPDDPGT